MPSSRTSPQDLARRFLMGRFSEMQLQNPRYSLRAFARRLGSDASALSQFFRKKRRLSWNLLRNYLLELGCDAATFQSLESAFNKDDSTESSSEAPATVNFELLDFDRHALLADWVPSALLSLAKTPSFRADPAYMAWRLGITIVRAADNCDRLISSGLLVRDPQTLRFVPAHSALSSDDALAVQALRLRHRQTLDLAAQALVELPTSERYLSSLTLTLSRERYEEALQKIRQFEAEFAAFAELPDDDDVYELSLQLIPRTQLNNKNQD